MGTREEWAEGEKGGRVKKGRSEERCRERREKDWGNSVGKREG